MEKQPSLSALVDVAARSQQQLEALAVAVLGGRCRSEKRRR